MTLPRTYNIDIRKILRQRRGQYDLEDEFLWFYEEVSRDSLWSFSKELPVTLSENAENSIIQLDCPNIELMNQKQNFIKYCGREEWVPQSIIIRLNDGHLTDETVSNILALGSYRLLFLKKAGPGIGGGFDVTPIYNDNTASLIEKVILAIKEQNVHPDYRRKIFILQAGVSNPLLTPLGQKLDLRLYMLAVGDGTGKVAFYACNVGNIRNTAAYPYDPTSTDRKIQITNVAQNRARVKDLGSITRIFSDHSFSPGIYENIFKKFLYIVRRISMIYGNLIGQRDVRPFVTLIGLDAVVDRETYDPIIVEMNRRPTVYSRQEAEDMQHSSTIFMRDVFRLGVKAIVNDKVGQIPSKNSSFVLVCLKD